MFAACAFVEFAGKAQFETLCLQGYTYSCFHRRFVSLTLGFGVLTAVDPGRVFLECSSFGRIDTGYGRYFCRWCHVAAPFPTQRPASGAHSVLPAALCHSDQKLHRFADGFMCIPVHPVVSLCSMLSNHFGVTCRVAHSDSVRHHSSCQHLHVALKRTHGSVSSNFVCIEYVCRTCQCGLMFRIEHALAVSRWNIYL